MGKNIAKINHSFDRKIRNTCERIPLQKRKFMVLGLGLSFILLFSFMVWDTFHPESAKGKIKIEHITPLDLSQDTLVNKLKKYSYGK